jgi:hypothetical protein
MICSRCGGFHLLGEKCPEERSFNTFQPSYNFDPPKPLIDLNIPRYEPIESIVPRYEPIEPFRPTFQPIEPLIPRYEPIEPIIPHYEPIEPFRPMFQPIEPLIDLNTPRYGPIEPLIPPPEPVRYIDNTIIGYKSPFTNTISPTVTGLPELEINPGGFVYDRMDNLVGEMGPGNVMMPPSLPQMPDYGPPQSTPEAWDPGFSPMGPFG